MTGTAHPLPPARLDPADVRVDDLDALPVTTPGDVPLADEVRSGVPVYDTARLLSADRDAAQAELVHVLLHGAGIVVLSGAFGRAEIDAASAEFDAMIAGQRASGSASGDHFARPGANDRIWNALEKLALRAPDVFVAYYANPALALVCEAWLGPGYQVTSQVNVVNPGGAAQQPHRDYHLGFLSPAHAARYPAHIHRLSPALTLQGAVAHVDMPVESGPTLYLPGSQSWSHGYLAADRQDVRDRFARDHVQLPLRAGDAVFFNPALLHGAGHNRSADIRRTANLLQVSSAFGRAMERVDRSAVARAMFGALTDARRRGTAPDLLDNAVAAGAEGYAFPTDLDADPPVDGLAPPSPADVLRRAVHEDWPAERFDAELADRDARRAGILP